MALSLSGQATEVAGLSGTHKVTAASRVRTQWLFPGRQPREGWLSSYTCPGADRRGPGRHGLWRLTHCAEIIADGRLRSEWAQKLEKRNEMLQSSREAPQPSSLLGVQPVRAPDKTAA